LCPKHLNTPDLAFFRAIQSLQYQKPAKNLDKRIEIINEAYTDLPLDVCKNVWATAQLVMNQVLLCNGGNDYKIPHVGKLKISAAACENIHSWISLVGDLAFSHQGEIFGFKFPKRFSGDLFLRSHSFVSFFDPNLKT